MSSNKRPFTILKRGGKLCASFMDTMFDNMWTFMNPDTIKSILLDAKCNIRVTRIDEINNDNFLKRHENTICFKGPVDEGHYVYVDNLQKGHGTYENGLIHPNDDGMCHGAALFYALQKNGIINGIVLYDNPINNSVESIDNYITLLSMYLFIINKGWWDNALNNFFYNDVTHYIDQGNEKIMETTKTKITLENMIGALINYKQDKFNDTNFPCII